MCGAARYVECCENILFDVGARCNNKTCDSNLLAPPAWEVEKSALFSQGSVESFYIQYPQPVIDCAPNVTADRPAHWSAQSITGCGYCLNVIGVLLHK